MRPFPGTVASMVQTCYLRRVIHTSSGWVHTWDPFALQFTEGFGIRWYGLAYLAGFAITYFFAAALARRGRTPLRLELIGDFVFAAAVGTVLGGRIGYCLFYDQSLLTQWKPEFPFWGVLMIHHGGMASHGGILGLVLACAWFGRRHHTSFPALLDLTATGGTLGIFFGRLANFINGELVGRPCDATLSWAVRFPQDMWIWPSQEPERLHSLSTLVPEVGISSMQWDQAVAQAPRGDLIFRGIEGLVSKVQSGDSEFVERLAMVLTPRYPSQLIAALLEGLVLFLVSSTLWAKKAQEGVVAGAFLMLYPLMRILSEGYRLPDLQIGYQLFGLTRGQWLSLVMFILSTAGLIWWSRRGKVRT